MRGTLSINQTNPAAWHALLDGVVVLTNQPAGIVGMPIDPTASYGTNADTVSYILDSPEGINTLRTNFAGKNFPSRWRYIAVADADDGVSMHQF